MLGSREGDDLGGIKLAILRVCLNECVNESDEGRTSYVGELLEQDHHSKPTQKCLAKCVSLPSAVSLEEDDDDEIGSSLRWLFSEDSVQSSCSRLISFPTPLKPVSALKGSREKRGLPTKELKVTWAPDVYDPLPTLSLRTVRGKKQQKPKKNYDKKRTIKKGHKVKNSSRSSSKDTKQYRRTGGSSDKWYDYKPLEVHISGNLDGFKIGSSTDPFCGTSFLKKSPTKMHYSVAEAL